MRDGRITVHTSIDEIKERVRRLRVQTSIPLPTTVSIPGLISRHDRQDGTTLVVNGDAEAIAARLTAEHHATVVCDAMSLEDMATEMLR